MYLAFSNKNVHYEANEEGKRFGILFMYVCMYYSQVTTRMAFDILRNYHAY